jgi:aspartate racemase
MKQASITRALWGIVGGLGPFASAEFVKTIYERDAQDREQDSPRIVMLSDPTMPDRTACLLRGEPTPLIDRLHECLDTLLACGATRLVICCVTIHAVLPALPETLRASVLSLVDLLMERLASTDDRCLMLCSSGTRAAGVLQSHPRWAEVRDRIVWPDGDDQESVHELIYTLKRGHCGPEDLQHVCSLMERYGVKTYIAGCTELHLLTRLIQDVAGRPFAELCVDPLMLAAGTIAGEGVPSSAPRAATGLAR